MGHCGRADVRVAGRGPHPGGDGHLRPPDVHGGEGAGTAHREGAHPSSRVGATRAVACGRGFVIAGAADLETLLEKARSARTQAYAPYSDFLVGAAVATDAGRFHGPNGEN